MRMRSRQMILFTLAIASLLLAPALTKVYAAPTYVSGVKPGNTATYGLARSFWSLTGPTPTFFTPFMNLNYTTTTVTQVTGANVTAAQVFVYNNKTTRQDIIQGSLANSGGNLTFWILAANLTAGDPVYTITNSPVINQTITETYAGVARTVNVYDSDHLISSSETVIEDIRWDQRTGIVLNLNLSIFSPTGGATLFTRLIATNMWSPGPSVGISASPSFISIQPGKSAQSFPFLTSERGFTGTISLNSSTLPCTALCPNVTINPPSHFIQPGLGLVFDVNITIATNTPVASYPITLNAVSGSSILNATTVLVQVAGLDESPTASFTYSPQPARPSQSVFFSGSPSSDPDGFISNYSWNFGDGSISFGEFPSHVYTSPGNYTVSLFVTDSGGLNATVSQTVNVIGSTFHSVGIVGMFVSPSLAVSGEQVIVNLQLVNGGQQTETVNVTVYYGTHVAVVLTGLSIPANPFTFYANAPWDTTGVVPGNYTMSATVFLLGNQASNSHFVDGRVTILPPPVLAVNPTSGPVGTKVTLRGSGFPFPTGSFYPISVEVTFDDNFVGYKTITNGTFDFVFDVPVSQLGLHEIDAYTPSFPSQVEASANFTVTLSPSAVALSVSGGSFYFPGDTATFYLISTLNGSPTRADSISLVLVLPGGTSTNVKLAAVSMGVYKATYQVPTSGSIGTYGVVATAQINGVNSTSLGSFEVKPTWLQSNGHQLATAGTIAGAIGSIGIIGFAWKKGYLTKRKEDFPIQ